MLKGVGRHHDSTLRRSSGEKGNVQWDGNLYRVRHDIIFADQSEPISNFLSRKLSAVRPRLNWNEQTLQWETGWDVGSLEGAMYLMVFFDIQGRGHILKCPWCKKVFLGDHPRTEYCSRPCQNNAKVARHRAKQSAINERPNRPLQEKSHGKTQRER